MKVETGNVKFLDGSVYHTGIIAVSNQFGRVVVWERDHPELYAALVKGEAAYYGDNLAGMIRAAEAGGKNGLFYKDGEAPGDVAYFGPSA